MKEKFHNLKGEIPMKRFTQLVFLASAFGLFALLLSLLPSRPASAALSNPAARVSVTSAPSPVGLMMPFNDEDNHHRPSGSVAIGAVAAHLVGEIVIDGTGTGQWIGYLPYLAGVNGTFFSGAPGEATAYFTFRSTSFQEQVISNGNLTEIFPNAVGGPLEIHVYINGNPNGNFQSPDSFSDGQLIATLQPERAMGTDTGSLTFAAGTYNVVSGSDFTFQGQTYNIRELTRSMTIALTFGTPVPGESAGSTTLVSSFGGYALAVGRSDHDPE
jgi:hypothetical protein